MNLHYVSRVPRSTPPQSKIRLNCGIFARFCSFFPIFGDIYPANIVRHWFAKRQTANKHYIVSNQKSHSEIFYQIFDE